MATALAASIYEALQTSNGGLVAAFDRPETRIEWPGQPKNLWPLADISGALVGGDRFIVEIDDHADPVRSIVKYWPLLEGIANGGEKGHRIRLVGASRRDNTFGEGFQILAQFVGGQIAARYPKHFRYAYVALAQKSPVELAAEISQALGEAW